MSLYSHKKEEERPIHSSNSDASNVKSSQFRMASTNQKKHWYTYTNKYKLYLRYLSIARFCELSLSLIQTSYWSNQPEIEPHIAREEKNKQQNKERNKTNGSKLYSVGSNSTRAKKKAKAKFIYEFRKRRERAQNDVEIVMFQWFFHIHVSITETITNAGQNRWYCFHRYSMSSLCFGGHTIKKREEYALHTLNLLTSCKLHKHMVRCGRVSRRVYDRWPSNRSHHWHRFAENGNNQWSSIIVLYAVHKIGVYIHCDG